VAQKQGGSFAFHIFCEMPIKRVSQLVYIDCNYFALYARNVGFNQESEILATHLRRTVDCAAKLAGRSCEGGSRDN
jgi:hypothetical protein